MPLPLWAVFVQVFLLGMAMGAALVKVLYGIPF